MKKLVVLFAMVAMATPAFGSIVNSKHDLSTGGAGNPATGTDQVCVFCHTPHAANTTNPNAPLWNRSLVSGAISDFYNSATLDDATRPSAAGLSAAINASDVKLCLSCHDGAGAVDVDTPLRNPPGDGSTMDYTPLAGLVTGDALIGTDLRDDHPIGMVYDAVVTNDSAGFESVATITAVGPGGGLTLYDGGRMWCSTCHDVHNPLLGTPFLAKTNAASALCTTCHIK